mgnify:CR=1 FL=1
MTDLTVPQRTRLSVLIVHDDEAMRSSVRRVLILDGSDDK